MKIHRSELIEDMYHNEYLYFNQFLKNRSDKSDDRKQLDPREGNTKNIQVDNFEIQLDDKVIKSSEIFSKVSGIATEYYTDVDVNICSLYTMEIEENQPPKPVNKEVLNMGDKSLLIFDVFKFFEVLDKWLDKEGCHYSRKPVWYYDPKTLDGEISLHHKDIDYSFQNEYRILVQPCDNKPIKVPIKGLKEFSTIVQTKNLNNIRFRTQNRDVRK